MYKIIISKTQEVLESDLTYKEAEKKIAEFEEYDIHEEIYYEYEIEEMQYFEDEVEERFNAECDRADIIRKENQIRKYER